VATLAGNVTTTGNVNLASTTLNTNSTIATGAGTSSTGAITGSGNNLIFTGTGTHTIGASTNLGALSSTNLTTTGNVVASSVTTTGAATLGGNVNTTGAQSYTGPVTLAGNVTVAASAVTFLDKVDATTAGSQSLTVNAPGVTNFSAAVGSTAALSSLNTDAAGTTFINGNVDALGPITIGDASTLANAISISANGITFSGSVSTADVLLNAKTGNVTATNAGNDFQGTVSLTGASLSLSDKNALTLGPTSAAGNLKLITSGNLAFNGDANIGGTLDANTTSLGNITQTNKLLVAGTSNLTAVSKDINLSNPANDFTTLIVAAGNVAVNDSTGIFLTSATSGNLTSTAVATTLGNTAIGGNLDVSSSGPITQTSQVSVAGSTTLRSVNANINLSSAANLFAGPLALTLGSGTASVTSGKGLDLGASDYGTAAVTLRAGASNRTGTLIKGGMAADAGNLSASTSASFTQSGALTSAVGGTLLLASPTEGDVLLNTQTNDLKGTIATTALAANPINNFQVKSTQVNMGLGGVTARSVVLVADKVTTPNGINGSLSLVKRGDNSVVLTFRGLTGNGSFGEASTGKAIYVDVNDYVAVMPNKDTTAAAVVYLEGTRDYKPAYEFTSDATFRAVVYNGDAADSPQIRGALSSAVAPLRDTIKEQLSAGFSRENLRKQLSEGVVLQTGVAGPAIDRIENTSAGQDCEVAGETLVCAAN
jgi:hypothetical protein